MKIFFFLFPVFFRLSKRACNLQAHYCYQDLSRWNWKVKMKRWNEKARKKCWHEKKGKIKKAEKIQTSRFLPLRLAPTSFTTTSTILNDECCPHYIVHGRKKDFCQFPFFLLHQGGHDQGRTKLHQDQIVLTFKNEGQLSRYGSPPFLYIRN